MSDKILNELNAILQERKDAKADDSYVAGLYAKGLDSILKKIGEEATETVMAAKDGNQEAIIHETADLWFHCMVMLANEDIDVSAVLNELARRFGVSGLEEKAKRNA